MRIFIFSVSAVVLEVAVVEAVAACASPADSPIVRTNDANSLAPRIPCRCTASVFLSHLSASITDLRRRPGITIRLRLQRSLSMLAKTFFLCIYCWGFATLSTMLLLYSIAVLTRPTECKCVVRVCDAQRSPGCRWNTHRSEKDLKSRGNFGDDKILNSDSPVTGIRYRICTANCKISRHSLTISSQTQDCLTIG